MKNKLTKSEINHLIILILDNERDGTYYGNKKHYHKRSFNIKKKLLDSTEIFSICPRCIKEHNNVDYIGFCSEDCYNKSLH